MRLQPLTLLPMPLSYQVSARSEARSIGLRAMREAAVSSMQQEQSRQGQRAVQASLTSCKGSSLRRVVPATGCMTALFVT